MNQLFQKQVKTNLVSLVVGIIREKTIQIWRISKDKREYANFHNLLNGRLKNPVDVNKLNSSLMAHQLGYVKGKYTINVIYDGSDIRKGESYSMEHLGWVKTLEGQWVRFIQLPLN